MKAIHKEIDPKAVFERGFVTKKETESTDIAKASGKVNLVDSGGESEGIWIAFLDKESKARYDNDSSSVEFWGVLLNDALHYLPNRSWGRVVSGKTNGSYRPRLSVEAQVEKFKATNEAYSAEFLPEKEGKDEENE